MSRDPGAREYTRLPGLARSSGPSSTVGDWSALTSPLTSHAVELGEAPIYDNRTHTLHWIDVFGQAFHSTEWGSGDTRSWPLPSLVGSYALTEDPSVMLLGLHDGLSWLDLASGRLTPFVAAPYDQHNFRFNDGRCDRAGRFWIGTIRLPGSQLPNGSGHFYRLDSSTLVPAIGGVTVANGIAFAPDNRTMYLADRVNERLLAYDYDLGSGAAGSPRTFASLGPADVPDGAAIDTDGCYWVAMFGAGEVRRYGQDGALLDTIPLPVSRPTMCAFAGPELNDLVVTTARWGLDADTLAKEPLAGAILRVTTAASGLPEPRLAHATPHSLNGEEQE